MSNAMLNAKEAAILDMREELSKQGKRFISFIESLDDMMEALCQREEKQRDKHKNGYVLSGWTLKRKSNERRNQPH